MIGRRAAVKAVASILAPAGGKRKQAAVSGGFNNPIVGGGGALVYPSIHSPNFNIANPPASPAQSWAILKNGLAYLFGVTITGGTITGPDYIINSSGAFFYTGTPALGNLAISIVPGVASVTDPEGNTAKPGITAYDAAGADYIQLLSSAPSRVNIGTGDAAEATPGEVVSGFLGSGPTRRLAAEILAPKVAGEAAGAQSLITLASPSADLTQGGFVSISAGDGVGNSSGVTSQFGQVVATASSVSGTSTLTQATGGVTFTSLSGFSGTLPVSQSDVTQLTAAVATFARITKSWVVPANDANTGTPYRLSGRGSGTQAGTSAVNLLFNVTAFGVTVAQISFPATFAAAAAGFVFNFVADVTVRVTGGTATIDVDLVAYTRQSGTSTTTFQSTTATSAAAVTNATEQLFVSAEWSSIVNAPTLTCNGSLLERLGA